MSGALLLGIVSVICVTDLAIAFYFSRPHDPEGDVGAALKTVSLDPAKAHQFARIMFITAPLMWLFIAALCFGLFGPIKNITPIAF